MQMLKLQVEHLENKNSTLKNSSIKLAQTVRKLQKKVSACYCKKSHYVQLLTSSDMVDFYAGIENIDAFSTIHSVFDIDYIPFAIDIVSPIVWKRWCGY